MKAKVYNTTMEDRKLPSPITIWMSIETSEPEASYYIPPLHVHIELETYNDIIILSRLLYHSTVDTIEARDSSGKEPTELIIGIRRKYLPLTLHYYYDRIYDKIVYIRVKGDKIIVKDVLKDASTWVDYRVKEGDYPINMSNKIINLLEKLRYIIT